MKGQTHYRHEHDNGSRPAKNRVLLIFLIACVFLVLIAGLAANFFVRDADDTLSFVKALYFKLKLVIVHDDLTTPLDPGADMTLFRLESGTSAKNVAEQLVTAGIIGSEEMLTDYLVYYGLDRELEAGLYEVSASLTIPELADKFTSGDTASFSVQVLEGWRREQIGEYIDSQKPSPFSGNDFLVATAPGSEIPQALLEQGDVYPGAGLEGFLFPDTYKIPLDATPEDLILEMVTNYLNHVTDQMRADATANGLSMYEVLILASIVEREVIHPDEAPEVASVYLNRIKIGMRLEACPTVQYAKGYSSKEESWWPAALELKDYQTTDSLFNTYLYDGLPPAPIANPGIDAIMAVIYPADTPYYFFRAACDGSGRHEFAESYEEHLANACE